MARYDYNFASNSWIIYRVGSEADLRDGDYGSEDDEGGIVGTSEWIWLDEEWARRIVAALEYFDDMPTSEIEALAKGE